MGVNAPAHRAAGARVASRVTTTTSRLGSGRDHLDLQRSERVIGAEPVQHNGAAREPDPHRIVDEAPQRTRLSYAEDASEDLEYNLGTGPVLEHPVKRGSVNMPVVFRLAIRSILAVVVRMHTRMAPSF